VELDASSLQVGYFSDALSLSVRSLFDAGNTDAVSASAAAAEQVRLSLICTGPFVGARHEVQQQGESQK